MKALILLLLLPGCITLDALLPFHSNIPCTDVDESICEDEDDVWDKVCTQCEDYASGPWWTEDYPWRAKTLDTVETIRPIETAFQQIPFLTEDGSYSLDAWYLPSHGEIPEVQNTLIVFNHGRYAGINHYAPRVRFFHELGYPVYVWDYRGYGHSLPTEEGVAASSPSTPNWMADAALAFEQARNIAPDPDKIIIYGMSVGGMPAGEQADLYDGCAQVYEASYNSISAKVETNIALSLPGSFLTSGLIENEVKLADTTIPALILHGDNDDRIHIDEARRLYDAMPEDLPKSWVIIENAGHGMGGDGGVPEQGLGAYGKILLEFLQEKAPSCLSEG
jgi:pimeloyl-ACP methyl ester carboxylesterase